MKKGDVTPKAQLQASNGAIVTTVANNPKAIGYIGFGYVSNTIKVLDVDGIPATIQNGKTGKYPISRKLFMYVNEKNYSPAAKAFVNFVLGAQGQRLVKDADYIPLR
jgi:phosphate transport system substrate-binding protein